ncbi:MAG TPA: PVC-type heme-binding CxxCH protein [Methylomirabilota bacterium]|nr:PVC-type heme-binding CxxCH protein [Methylomirabilota bacterium]
MRAAASPRPRSASCGCLARALLPVLLPWLSHAIDGPLTPQQSLDYLKTEPGLRVELVAAEPLVIDPVAVAWDEKGRLFVVEDRGYPIGPPKGQPPVGQVVLLEDTDGDGKYDKRTVFADGLTFPNGIMPWDGGVYVTCAPFLYYFKDTDGDGKADLKRIVFKGFQDLSTTQLRVSHPTLNLDNWVYLTSGLTAAKVTAPEHPDKPMVFLNRVDARFRPGTDDLQETAGTAQFGQTFDRFGRRFICSNRNHIQHVVLQLQYLKRNPHLSLSSVVEDIPDHEAACRVYPLSANITTAAFHAGFITSACGVTIYDGTALPESYRGDSFTCEPAGNLVHHDILSPKGATFVARRPFPTNEFLASPDNWFRPVNLANGPDGALYVCDMYRKTIEHPEYLPEATRKVTDFESGKDMGRIYRVVADRPQGKKIATIDLAKATTDQLCADLESPNTWWRMTAQRLLLQRRDSKAVPRLEALCSTAKSAEARVQALHILDGLGALPEALVTRALQDQSPAVREHALQLSESLLPHSPGLTRAAIALAEDPDPRVRFQCALSLGEATGDRVVAALASIAARDLDDKWARAAVLTSIAGREEAFLRQFIARAVINRSDSLPLLMGELGRLLATSLPEARRSPVLGELMKSSRESDLPWQMAAVGGFGEGLRSTSSSSRPALLALADGNDNAISNSLAKLFRQSAGVALDNRQSLPSRVAAVALLGQGDYPIAGKPLETLVEPQQPGEVQTAAIRSLSQLGSPEAGAALVTRARWNGYTPAVRDSVLSALLANTNFIQSLLTAIEQGDVPAWTVNADRRTALMRHKDDSIKARAVALFKDLQPSDRMKVYEEYKTVLSLKGNPANGHAVFQKNCITCHTFAGEGSRVGPDLTGIRNQPAEVLLLHIIVPEYEIMPIYTCYNVETRQGQGFTGLLAAETATSITLRMAQGLEQQVPRSEIASMTTSRLSLMPQELEKAMSKQDLADLLAFLKGYGDH